MTSNRTKREPQSKGRLWHNLALKKLSALSRGINSKYYGDLYCLNCFHFLKAKPKLESHKGLCENNDFSNAFMPSEDTKILECN